MPSYNELTETFANIETAISNNTVNIIPLDENEKFPSSYSWKDYQKKQYPLKYLKSSNGNFGIIIGYQQNENEPWIGCLDIDGVKEHPQDEEEEWKYTDKTKEDIYNILKELKDTIIVKSQSGGYHIYFKTKKSYNQEELLNIHFPKDYEIEELKNHVLGKAVELFTNNNRQMATAPSTIENNKYEVISSLNDFNKMEVYNDIVKTVTDLFVAKGYIHKENEEYITSNKPLAAEDKDKISADTQKTNFKRKTNNKEVAIEKNLKESDILVIARLLAPYFKKMEGQHNGLYMALSGFLKRNNITIESATKLINMIMDFSEDTAKDHIRELRSTYKSTNKNQTGLNRFSQILHDNKDKFGNSKIEDDIEILKEKIKPNPQYMPDADMFMFNDKYNLRIAGESCYWVDSKTMEMKTAPIYDKKLLNENYSIRDKKIATALNEIDPTIKKEDILNFLREIGINYAENKKITSTTKNKKEEEKDPWEEILEKPTDKSLHMPIAIDLESEYNIKRIINNGNAKYYCYDTEEEIYNKLNQHKLGVLIKKDYFINLPDTALKSILSCIQREDIIHNDKWIFKNCIFNTQKFEIEDTARKGIICINKIGVEEKSKKITLLEYNDNVNYFNNGEEETFMEKTLKQILIPKDNPEYMDLYFDYLQRVGSCLLEEQYHKTIPVYRGEGDNAKSILNILLRYVFNKHHRVITPDSLKDNFSNSLIENTSVLAFDELKKESFLDFIDYLKKISGGGLTQAQRRMYSEDISEVSDFGMIWAFTNEVPKIPIHEKALFRRLDVLELPNTFVEKKYLNDSPNNYLMVKGIQYKLKEDLEGLSWLISVAIKAYKEMIDNNENFKCKQTADETLAIINKTNYLETFIATYTEIDNTELTSNKEILEAFEEWIDFREYPFKTDNNTNADIGYKLKDLYKDNLDKKDLNGRKHYNIKLKNRSEVEEAYKYIYKETELDIIEKVTLDPLENDAKKVLEEIRNGNNSVNKIKYVHDNINVFKQIKLLEAQGIIENTFATA